MIICEGLQSKHLIGRVGSFEQVQNTFLGTRGKQWPGESTHYFQVQGVHLEGPSVDFTLCASSLWVSTKYVNLFQAYITCAFKKKMRNEKF